MELVRALLDHAGVVDPERSNMLALATAMQKKRARKRTKTEDEEGEDDAEAEGQYDEEDVEIPDALEIACPAEVNFIEG